MAEAAQGARPKRGRIVQSRYLQYDRKPAGKADSPGPSATKGPERAAFAKRPPVPSQKQKSTLQQTFKLLHSTALEGHEITQSELELSVINDKSQLLRSLPTPNPAVKGTSRRDQILESEAAESERRTCAAGGLHKGTSADVDNWAGMLESQMLLLTYASAKMEKNLALLEEKSEKDLLVLLDERGKLQEDVHRKKLRLLQLKKDQELSDALDRQLEVLGPVAERCAKFQEEYKHFATALDSTRHELPMKGIHVGESQSRFLADLQEYLAATQSLLKQNLQEHSEHNAEVLGVVKELEEASLKLNNELPRGFSSVLNLSAHVSKEVSLHSQKTCEDTLGLEVVKQLYFP